MMLLNDSSIGIIGGADGPTAVFVASLINPQLILMAVLSCVIAYVLGSLSFAVIVSKGFYKKDIRTFGSGNAGMTNVLRTFGKKAAIVTVIGDVGKGIVAIFIAKYLFGEFAGTEPIYGAYLAAIFAVLGHLFPVFFKFKGGKGVSVAFGAILVTDPVVGLCLILVFLLVVFTTKIVSLASVLAAVSYPIITGMYTWFFVPERNIAFCVVGSLIMAAMVLIMHRENIKRLLNGTEYKFGQKK